MIDSCEPNEFTIAIGDNYSDDMPDYWPLYDAQIELNDKGNFTFLGGVGDPDYPITFTNIFTIDGAPIAAFDPLHSGIHHTWDLGDIRHHNSNGAAFSPTPRIKFWMKKGCDATVKDWTPSIPFNDRCYDGTVPLTSTGPLYPDGDIILVRKGNPMINIVPPTVYVHSRRPHYTIQLWNGGTGKLFNLNVTTDNNGALYYYEHTSSGIAPDSEPGAG